MPGRQLSSYENAVTDEGHMGHALALARRGLGRVAPNPAVGCVIVSETDHIVGRGWTAPLGRPHAETIALSQAQGGARGGTAYVTLEPCAHLGHTPPCADTLINAGVKRVFASVEDPDPRVKGKGFARLRAAGIEVKVGILEKEARFLNAGFFQRLLEDRPLVTLKVARDRDGMTIPPAGVGRWITSAEARRFAHMLRANHDAILVGVNTVLADDPELTCRLPGLGNRSPLRLVLDTSLKLTTTAKLVRTARQLPTIVFTSAEGGDRLRSLGVEVLRVIRDEDGKPALSAVLGVLAGRGCTRLLVEGGPTLWSAFLSAGLADRLEVFTAPLALGDNSSGAVPELTNIGKSSRFRWLSSRMFGPDSLESFASTA